MFQRREIASQLENAIIRWFSPVGHSGFQSDYVDFDKRPKRARNRRLAVAEVA